MKKIIYFLGVVGAFFYASNLLSSQEISKDQLTSHLPKSLEVLYRHLDRHIENQHVLKNSLGGLMDKKIHKNITQALDVNSYMQKFLLQKIKMIEETHSSLADNQSLNVILHGSKLKLVMFVETRNA